MNNNPNNSVFLHKISEKINKGDYDKYLTIPFMSKELLISSIKNKLQKKLTKGTAPILTDSEISVILQETKETAANIFSLYLQSGIIEKTEDGYEVSVKGKMALRQSAIAFMFK